MALSLIIIARLFPELSTFCLSQGTFPFVSSCWYHFLPQNPTAAAMIHSFTSIRGVKSNLWFLSSSSMNPSDGHNKMKVRTMGWWIREENWADINNSRTEAPSRYGKRLNFCLEIGAFAATCGYWIIQELVPAKILPNSAGKPEIL